jgi:small neutral amino acid transporter SnatA (MarC family)
VRRQRKLWVALAIYAALALLEWFTLDDRKIRFAGLLILAFFAIRTLVQDRRAALEERSGRE